MKPKKQTRSKLERLVLPVRAIVCSAALALTPITPISSSQIRNYKPLNPVYAEEKHELGKAHQLLMDFQEAYQIPGARRVEKFPNPEANYLLVGVKKVHVSKKPMSRKYKKYLRKVHNDTYLIYSYFIEHFERKGIEIKGIHKETVTPETLEDYRLLIFSMQIVDLFEEIRRKEPRLLSREQRAKIRRDYKEQQEELAYDAVDRLAVEDKIEVLPAETLEANIRAGEMYKKILSGELDVMDEEANSAIFRERDLLLFDFGSRQRNSLVISDNSAMHADSLIESMEIYNSRPENRNRQYCAVLITPDSL